MKQRLIAPCGMNCNICVAYLRNKNKCPGCNLQGIESDYCKKCIIKNCPIIKKNKWKHCNSKCEKYPCKRLKDLDKRYRTKYGMSMIENLEKIKKIGIRRFIDSEKKRWINDGAVRCVHNGKYY